MTARQGVLRATLMVLMASVSMVPMSCCWAAERKQVVSVIGKRGDIDLIARTAFLEARSDGARGMAAVAHVILNRLRENPEAYGGTIREVVYKEAQFSVWGNGRAQRVNRKALSEHDPLYELARHAAWQALTGLSKDPTFGALYFHEKSIKPSWTRGMIVTARIGRHVYYKPRGG